MNASTAVPFTTGPSPDLQSFHTLCVEALSLVTGENQVLMSNNDSYKPGEFNERRKRLLPLLESALIKLKLQRQASRPAIHSDETAGLLQTIQSLLMKVLLFDRENQQALLRRGLVPAGHLPPVAVQRPHYVAGLYRQNSR